MAAYRNRSREEKKETEPAFFDWYVENQDSLKIKFEELFTVRDRFDLLEHQRVWEKFLQKEYINTTSEDMMDVAWEGEYGIDKL